MSATFVEFYANSLREPLFSGFLTIATFLFAVKTFLIVTLQKDVYGRPEYIEHVRQARREGLAKETALSPLKRLATRLFTSTVIAFVAAILQMTVGVVTHWLAALLCLLAATVSIVDLLFVLIIQKIVISDWLTAIDSDTDHLPESHRDQSRGSD